jgi:hypothetical protein
MKQIRVKTFLPPFRELDSALAAINSEIQEREASTVKGAAD